MVSRRKVLRVGAAASAWLLSPWRGVRRGFAQIPGRILPPSAVDKYVLPLVKPPAMPGKSLKKTDQYTIAVRQFEQQILSPPHPTTTVWSYGSAKHPETFNYPAFTIEARYNRGVEIIWKNELVDSNGNFLPHLLPVDPTLHWANPPGGLAGRDRRPTFNETPGSYMGPVPIVTHVHGAHTTEDSDGYAEAWYLPDAKNIPGGFARTGTFFDYFNNKYENRWAPGSATFEYPNRQRATTLWYHDHTLGMTRLNVYAGPAGFYLIRGGKDDFVRGNRGRSDALLPGPAPGVGDNPFGEYGEIPIAIQDRSFNTGGSLFYPDTREFFDEFAGPFIPDSPVSPIWNPEFFGNMIVVNGRTWPFLDVNRRRYRFRFLNGCNSRFLILRFNDSSLRFWQIGAEGGFLKEPVELEQLLLAPAERADVIVDFADATMDEIILENIGPDEPFGGGEPGVDFAAADPDSTGQVMQFRVRNGQVNDPTTPPQHLKLPNINPLGKSTQTQHLSLNEEVYEPADVPFAALLGRYDPGTGQATPLLWSDPITENPARSATETWKIHNLTVDAHPIHIHQVQFQVVGREAIGGGPSIAGSNDPLPWERGFKDTVIAYPGEVTTVQARFDVPGVFVWHCHIVEHEDNEMMRPFHVGPIPAGFPG